MRESTDYDDAQLRVQSEWTPLDEAAAGDIVTIAGLSEATVSHTIGLHVWRRWY